MRQTEIKKVEMQDSKREELRERMTKHEFLDSQLYRKDPIDGSWDSFTTVTENVLDFIATEISKAREEGRREGLEDILSEVENWKDHYLDTTKNVIREKLSKLTTK